MTHSNGDHSFDFERLGADEDRPEISLGGWGAGREPDAPTDLREPAVGFQHILGAALSQAVIPKLLSDVNRVTHGADERLRDLLLRYARRGDVEAARMLSRRSRRSGMRTEAVMADLLAPVANALGRSWEEDECDFASVTIGMRVLSAVLADLRQESPWRASLALGGTGALAQPTAMISAAPGETHAFGPEIVAESLFRAGWCTIEPGCVTADALLAAASRTQVDLIGLSVACDKGLETLEALIAGLRSASLNPNVSVVVGGAAFLRDPVAGTRAGADWTAIDAKDAVARAEPLRLALARRH